MTYGITPGGPADLSNNRFAASMKELANGLFGWASLLLFVFLLWQVGSTDHAKLFSLRTLLLVVLAELLFVVVALVANIVFAAFLAVIATPLALSGRVRVAQNFQGVMLAIFGVGLCIGVWFFARYATRYAYS